MKFVMIIWLAMGATQTESFPTEAACLQRLDQERNVYGRLYVIRAAGCFPRDLILKAGQSS